MRKIAAVACRAGTDKNLAFCLDAYQENNVFKSIINSIYNHIHEVQELCIFVGINFIRCMSVIGHTSKY